MTELSPQAQAIVDAYENTTDKYAALAAVLRAVVNECREVRGTGRVDKKSQVVSVKTLMKLIEDLEQF